MKKFTLILLILTLPSVSFSQIKDIFIKSPCTTIGHWLFNTQYDSISGSWSRIAPLGGAYFGTATYYCADSDKVFICGGIDSAGSISQGCFFYNVQTNSYEPKTPLPLARYLGKLVRVKDSLYLVGSVGIDFNIPDGKLFKYSIHGNSWVERAPVTGPALHEMAVCVWRDSLIIAVGGSSNAFGGAVNQVRAYNPRTNTWRILSGASNVFPINVTAAQAESIGNNIVVMGGYNNSGTINEVYRGYTYSAYLDSLAWIQDSISTPFLSGVYRIASSQYGNSMIFGPALTGTSCINQVWSFSVTDSTWTKFVPNSIDTASRTSIAVGITADSMFFYLFGGITRDSNYHFINSSERYSTVNPLIGIAANQYPVPQEFELYQNYPNPFNPVTKIKFQIPTPLNPPEGGTQNAFVALIVYDILGREIADLLPPLRGGQEGLKPGTYEVTWDGTNYPSGVYFYRLITDGYTETRKMVLIK